MRPPAGHSTYAMFEIKNVDELLAQITQWEKDITAMVEGVGRGLSIVMFRGVVERSAQYSGDFAANWKYSVGQPDLSFEAGLLGEPTPVTGDYGIAESGSNRFEGSRQAIEKARELNAGRPEQFKLGETAFISNSAKHDEPYAMKIWKDQIQFREGNQPELQARLTDEVLSLYAQINAEQALKLTKMRIA